ncbi:hypothetical protein VP01_2750g4 [Puccinia sorghi]|uniref:SUN domain-containing protein n=1 Tax=Puccinia sorghi TaxID=27349 RepID=A0A0L6V340_9BASI|nr:hypothetical protein VP01_2750g4 [Puccinia sorghi]
MATNKLCSCWVDRQGFGWYSKGLWFEESQNREGVLRQHWEGNSTLGKLKEPIHYKSWWCLHKSAMLVSGISVVRFISCISRLSSCFCYDKVVEGVGYCFGVHLNCKGPGKLAPSRSHCDQQKIEIALKSAAKTRILHKSCSNSKSIRINLHQIGNLVIMLYLQDWDWILERSTGTSARKPSNNSICQVGIIICITGITISHVSHKSAYKIQTAPTEFELWGLDFYLEEELDLLLTAAYNIHTSQKIKFFKVSSSNIQYSSWVVVKINSTHGPDLTYIYKI